MRKTKLKLIKILTLPLTFYSQEQTDSILGEEMLRLVAVSEYVERRTEEMMGRIEGVRKGKQLKLEAQVS